MRMLHVLIYTFHERISLCSPGTEPASMAHQFSKRTSNSQHEEVVLVPPFVPDPSKRNREREQKGRPHSFLVQSPLKV